MGKFARNFTLDVFNQEVPGAASEKAGIDDVAMELQLRLGQWLLSRRSPSAARTRHRVL